MKRNEIVEKLIQEGFSEKTLVKMSDKQLKLLSDRIISEQQNNTVNVSGDTPNLTAVVTKLKQGGNNVTVSEEEDVEEGSDKWIQKAIKPSKKGELHKDLGVPQGKKIPKDKLRTASHEKGKVGQRARMALNLSKLHEDELNEQLSDPQIFGALGLVLGAFGVAAFNSGKHYYNEYLQKHPEDKKGAIRHALQRIVNDAHDSGGNIAEDKRTEAEQLQEWVDLMVENEYNSVTTKNEIMNLISTKLQEQGREIEIADPDTETEVEPDVDTPPYEAPDEDPFIDPWKNPGTTPDPRPKFEKKKEDHHHLPDFLKFNNILGSVNEEKINSITSTVLNQLKSKSQNGKEK